jgi:hypothetical protein
MSGRLDSGESDGLPCVLDRFVGRVRVALLPEERPRGAGPFLLVRIRLRQTAQLPVDVK